MSTKTGADVWIAVDGYELTGYGTNLNDNTEAVSEQTHTFGDADEENEYAGLKSSMVDVQAFYDDAAGASNEALASFAGADRIMTYGVEGTAVGAECVGAAAVLEGKYSRAVERGKFHRGNASFKGSGQVDRCKLLRYGAHNGSSGDGTALDNGASSAGGGVGYQQVIATNGNFVGKIRHSTDNSTYADLLTFATVSNGNRAGERKTTAVTVNRYLRSNWANSGSTATAIQQFKRNA